MNDTDPIKIAVVDDHHIFRASFVRLLGDYPDLKVIFEASDGNELLDKLETNSVDVIILDLNMPPPNGIETTKLIRKKDTKVRILILTMYGESSFVVKSFEAKVNGYLVKTAKPEEVHLAITTVLREGVYSSDFVKDALLKNVIYKNHINPLEEEPVVEFTGNELQVLRLISLGKTSKQISKEIYKSKDTIDKYRIALLRKTNSHNTAELLMYCTKHNILL
ncbi:MAG: response regulator transcription factor [Saprospiraceae bacterium]|nr:response regulator transcription factor [Saprospiraceae bacterium]MBK7737519.1 response regulator transcription factor [Saprospiraceae bacterium]MBK7913898.1 response regulator transcription factor [Saprospiraceae bacterium]